MPPSRRNRIASGDGAFWREQETRWLKLAESVDLSARITKFLDVPDGKVFSPEAEEGVQTLHDIFGHVCRALALDAGDEALSRKIARTLIGGALGGESDPERLFAAAVKAAAN